MSDVDIQAPCPADISKLHAEMNQYINQRLIITTTAITLFGVSIGWIVFGSSTASGIEIKPAIFFLPTILLIVLFVLLVYCQVILGNMRIISGYMRQTQSSQWEKAYQEFAEKNKFIGQDDVFPMMFMVLGISVGLIVFFLWLSFPPEEKTNDYNIGASSTLFVIVWAVYLLAVILSWFKLFLNFGFQDKAEEKWGEVFKKWKEKSSKVELSSLSSEQHRDSANPEVGSPPQSGLLTLLSEVEAIQAEVPAEEWDKLPHDGSINHDHYLYGAPKVES